MKIKIAHQPCMLAHFNKIELHIEKIGISLKLCFSNKVPKYLWCEVVFEGRSWIIKVNEVAKIKIKIHTISPYEWSWVMER